MKKLVFLLVVFLLGITGGILSLHFFSFNYIEKYLLRGDKLDLIPVEVTEIREIFIREDEAIVNMIDVTERAVVGVKTKTKSGFIEGSGLIISSDGLMVTLNQLVPMGSEFSFLINGDDMPYEIIKRDATNNLALIKLGGANLPTLEFRNLENLKTGEKVFIVGVIFNEKQEVIKSVNQGIVKRFDDYIRTNIFEENKLLGSTLFDIEGKILGLNLINQWGEIYSIPVSQIQSFISL